jgi:hypothetical protein
MATVIDSLVVELGLDPKGAQKGAADFSAQIKKTRDVANTGAKDIEAYGKRAASFFSSLTSQAVGLFLAFQGASSITGFVSDLLHGDAATGRFAANIGMATSRLSAWQLVVGEAGGDAKDATTALGAMQTAYQSFLLTGDTGHNADFAGLGITKESLAKPEEALLKLAEAAEKMPKTEFYARASRLGIPDSVINTLEKGRASVEALVREKERDGAASQKDADAAAEYERQMAKMSAHIKGILRPEIYELVRGFDKLLGKITDGSLKLPTLTGALGLLAGAAIIADAPMVALGAAIAYVITNWEKWQHLGERARAYVDFNGGFGSGANPNGPAAAPAPVGGGPPLDVRDENGRPLNLGQGGGGGGQGAIPGVGGFERRLMLAGFSADQARGIHAGVSAEGGGAGFSSHVGAHGERAFGIGQWLGGRQKALFAKYGNAPSLQNQIEFLISELKGGDRGGASVRAGGGAQDTMIRYLRDFMRPQGAHNERYIDLVNDVKRGNNALRNGGRRGDGGGSKTEIHVATVNVHSNPQSAAALGADLRRNARLRAIAQASNRGLDH